MWVLKPDHVPAYAAFAGVFSVEECEALCQMGGPTTSAVVVRDGLEHHLDEETRKSDISWITPSSETDWVFRRLSDVVSQANSDVFQFDLFAIVDALQYGEYGPDGGHYEWHLDSWFGMYPRKLSLSVQLSPPDSYDGGNLELHVGSIETASRSQGSVILFPSYRLHRVTPVTRGTRRSLVTWIAGPAFR